MARLIPAVRQGSDGVAPDPAIVQRQVATFRVGEISGIGRRGNDEAIRDAIGDALAHAGGGSARGCRRDSIFAGGITVSRVVFPSRWGGGAASGIVAKIGIVGGKIALLHLGDHV